MHRQLLANPPPAIAWFAYINAPQRDDFRRKSCAAILRPISARKAARPAISLGSLQRGGWKSLRTASQKASRSTLIWQETFNRNNPEKEESDEFAHYARTSNSGPFKLRLGK
jgi:hypothetical protein